MEVDYSLPEYKLVEETKHQGTTYWVVGADTNVVPEALRQEFQDYQEVTHCEGTCKTIFLTLSKASKSKLCSKAFVRIDSDLGDTEHEHYLGYVSDFLSSVHQFDRKEKRSTLPLILIDKASPKIHRAINLAEAKNKSKELANGRGDIEGTPQYFKILAREFSLKHSLRLTMFSGKELLQEGFRLMHAVGRGSENEPVFINIAYEGNPESDKWTAFVGKGVCFDTGGYNIKSSKGVSIQLPASRICSWTSMEPPVSSRPSRP